MSGLGMLTKFSGVNCSCCSGFLSFVESHFTVDICVNIVAAWGVFTEWWIDVACSRSCFL